MERINPNKGDSVVDFDHLRAINEFVDVEFLNKTLAELRGGSKNDGETSTYRISNTNILANVHEELSSTGKKIYIVESLHKIPERFCRNNQGGAKMEEKKKGVKKPSGKKVKSSEDSELYSFTNDIMDKDGGKKKTSSKKPTTSTEKKGTVKKPTKGTNSEKKSSTKK